MEYGARPSCMADLLGGREGVRTEQTEAGLEPAVMDLARARDEVGVAEGRTPEEKLEAAEEAWMERARSARSVPGTTAFLRGAEPEVMRALALRSLAESMPAEEDEPASWSAGAIWRVYRFAESIDVVMVGLLAGAGLPGCDGRPWPRFRRLLLLLLLLLRCGLSGAGESAAWRGAA